MALVVVDVLELVRASNDGGTVSLSSFLPSPFALVPLSLCHCPCTVVPPLCLFPPGPGHECNSDQRQTSDHRHWVHPAKNDVH